MSKILEERKPLGRMSRGGFGFVTLRGEPYQQRRRGVLVDANRTLDTLAQNTHYDVQLAQRLEEVTPRIPAILEGDAYYVLDKKLKDKKNLSFNEAFQLITFVCSALNVPLYNLLQHKANSIAPHETLLLQATSLLTAVSVKEALTGLTPEEIAGMVAATIHLDTVARPKTSPTPVLAFGGMGGDKGYPTAKGQSKLFSLSTLSAIALAVDGKVHKHHSYPNTSKVAGQSAIEAYGVRSDFDTQEAMESILDRTNLLMTSCHNTRTLHTLSHVLRGETINHVIGPVAFTLSPNTKVQAFIGVNEKVHPETMIEALCIIQKEGFQIYGNSAVFCGTDMTEVSQSLLNPRSYYRSHEAKSHVRIDEVAPPPYATLAAFLVNGKNKGTYAIYPVDFFPEDMLQDCNLEAVTIPNTSEAIFAANNDAMLGQDISKAMYLAMTIGLGIFVREYLGKSDALDAKKHRVNQKYLRGCTQKALQLLKRGQIANKLQQYVNSTNLYAGGRRV